MRTTVVFLNGEIQIPTVDYKLTTLRGDPDDPPNFTTFPINGSIMVIMRLPQTLGETCSVNYWEMNKGEWRLLA